MTYNVYLKPQQGFWRYADTVGNGTGTTNFNGDYSGAEEQAILKPLAGQRLIVVRLIVMVADTSGMQPDEYGNLGAALGTGIEIKHFDADGTTVLNDMTGGVPVTTNGDWGALCYDVNRLAWGNSPTNEYLLVRWTFQRAGIEGIMLTPDQSIRVLFNDSLVGLLDHRFMFQGFDDNN